MTYDVVASRGSDERFWIVEIPALGGMTQALNRDGVEDMARDWIACKLDLPLNEVVLGKVRYDE